MEDVFKSIVDIANSSNQDVFTENANKSAEVFSTHRDLIAGEVAKYIAKEYLLPKHLAKEHNDGYIHIHDLDYAPLSGQTNCCLVDLADMLKNGFNMNGVAITQPTNINTAMTLSSQIVMAVASNQYGGISFDRFDEMMAEYVTKSYNKYLIEADDFGVEPKRYADSKIRKAVYDACQTLEYQVNSMTCVSGQSPFLSIGFGLGTSWEARLIQEMLLRVRIAGLGKDKVTAIFPKLIYTIKSDVNLTQSTPNYDIKQLALECSSKRIYPDILNYDKVVEVTGSFKASMGCRSFLSKWEEGGKEIHSGRTNLGVVTISLPMIAVEANKDIELFYKLLDDKLNIAKEVCEFRLDYLSRVQAKTAPVLYMEGALMRLPADECVLPHLIRRGSSISIGYIGLNETVNALVDEATHLFDSSVKRKLSLDILKYFDNRVKLFKEQSGVGYSSYATPSESQCKRLRDTTFNKFGLIAGVTDKEYFTNSFHLEAGKQTDVYSRMDFEAQYIKYSTGGFISYGELPNMKNNLEALENIWDYSYNVTPYYAVNTPADKCLECQFEGVLTPTSRGFVCPSCGNSDSTKLYAIRRISGYLSNPHKRPFNNGKTQECKDRVLNF